MTPEQIRNEKLGLQLVKTLEARHFEAYYCHTKEEAKQIIISLIPKEDTVAWGGSATMNELGIIDYVKNENFKVIDRDLAKTPEEKLELMRQSLLSDTFLSGANAITEDGEIINIDGNGNRVAALTFGPKSVVIACGINKIVRSAQDAETRARTIAAPINAQRFDLTTPCIATGRCCDCKSPQSICSVISRIRLCKPKGRIKVVIIGESLGF